MRTMLLTGSRGLREGTDSFGYDAFFRISHRSLPLALIEDMSRQFRNASHITAVGGGTVLDAAKAYFSLQKPAHGFLKLIPTTFGTGAEVTPFATVYDQTGRKLSLELPPSVTVSVQYQPELLQTLPDIELRSGFCDAFTHAFESLWSTRRTRESMAFARDSLQLAQVIWRNWDERVLWTHAALLQNMGRLAGEAIAQSQTTAAHALSYEWTQRYGIPHGFSVVSSLPALAKLADTSYQCKVLGLTAHDDLQEFLGRFVQFFVPDPYRKKLAACLEQGRMYAPSSDRLKNFPVSMDEEDLRQIDRQSIQVLDPDTGPLFILKKEDRSRHLMGAQPPGGPMNSPLT